jgi:hypothetical protein
MKALRWCCVWSAIAVGALMSMISSWQFYWARDVHWLAWASGALIAVGIAWIAVPADE